MPSNYGQLTTDKNISLGINHISIEDLVGRYPAKKFPLLNRLNGNIFKKAVDNRKYEWKEEQLRPTKDVLAAAISSTGATSLLATTSGIFNKDDVILIDSEYMIINAISSDGLTAQLTRGWGSTAATHSNGATITRVGVAANEGADADGALFQGLSDLYNYSQIFEDVVELSGNEQNALIFKTDQGNDNATNQIAIKQQELMEQLQNALLLGVRNYDGVKRYTMGGLKYFIDTYAAANARTMASDGSDWLTQSTFIPTVNTTSIYTKAQEKLDTLIQDLVYQRSTPSAIYVGYKALRRMMTWDIEKMDTSKSDAKGYQVPAKYLSQAGELDLVYLPGDALNDLIFVVDESQVGYKAFNNRGWFTKQLAENGDSSKWQVLGDYTEKVGTPLVHGYIKTLGL